MLESLGLPQWFVDFWSVYGNIITPVLVTILCSLGTYLAVKIKADAKRQNEKTDLELQALKEVANREDNKAQLDEQNQKLVELSNAITYLGQMMDLVFQNSTLDPEIKNTLTALANKIKYGTEEELVKELETQKEELQKQLNLLKEELKSKTVSDVVDVVENVIEKTRRR